MLKSILDFVIIVLLSVGGLTHVARLIYLFFSPGLLSRIKFISNPVPAKGQLALYYLLTIVACIYAIAIKAGI